ncbi:MAG: hypothetical protein KKC75_06270 [Nanoarchaeota archaeon]|nr:hypothetical protein [Nanoarchaeota archaeon]MBU1004261.1 hypothetical protein [Nanoarchaeota archaeon]MBU1946138.1 hypothetical protein [Nanoarchaeota archaeon]
MLKNHLNYGSYVIGMPSSIVVVLDIFGKVLGDISLFRQAKDGDKVLIEKC